MQIYTLFVCTFYPPISIGGLYRQMAVFCFLTVYFKPRLNNGERDAGKVRNQNNSGKSEIFSELFPIFRLFSANIVGVGIYHFIWLRKRGSFSFKQGVPGSIPGWLTKGISLCNHILVYYKGFSYFLSTKKHLSFCITAIEKAVNFGFNAPELI